MGTVRVESKKQRNKNTKQTRVIKKTVPTESFFNFFAPPVAPTDEDDVASDIEEKLIPRAIDWFTGEALAFEEFEDAEDAEFDDEDDEDDEDEEEAESDEEDEEEGGKPRSQQASECKNQ